mgnify:CR=1 FL=1
MFYGRAYALTFYSIIVYNVNDGYTQKSENIIYSYIMIIPHLYNCQINNKTSKLCGKCGLLCINRIGKIKQTGMEEICV